jgi:basic membrane protein A
MRKSLFVSIVFVLLISLVVAGCSSGTTENQSPNSEDTEEKPIENVEQPEPKLKVGLLLSGPISDMGYNASAYEGLMEAQKKFDIEVNYHENVAQSDMESILRNYAVNGYGLIFGHGYQFTDAIVKVAAEFPDIKFVINSGRDAFPPNVASSATSSSQQGFLMGATAALITESKIVGAIGGQEIPSIKETIEGMKKGVAYVDPDVKILTTFTGSFDDVAKAKETALAMIDQGADVIMASANQAGLGTIEACVEKGVLAIGCNEDQNPIAPDTVVTSGIKSVKDSVVFMVEKVLNNEFEPIVYKLGVKEGVVYLAPWHGFEEKIPQEIKDEIAQITQDLADGKIEVKIN